MNGKYTHYQKPDGEFVPIVEMSFEPVPVLTIEWDEAGDFIKELNGMNIKTDSHFKIEGELDATKYHLEDLRTLLKLDRNICQDATTSSRK